MRYANGKSPISEETPHKPKLAFSPANFAMGVDYMEEERPFFVKIGKYGLIAALQKLDKQLRAVWAPSHAVVPRGYRRSRGSRSPRSYLGRTCAYPVDEGNFGNRSMNGLLARRVLMMMLSIFRNRPTG